MEDEKLQKLHDTLAMLRPKGRTGGLGRGGLGVSKVKGDGLPDNALYSRFVREGQGNFSKVKKFEDDDDKDKDGSDDDDAAAKKKKKKGAKKAKKEKEAADEAAAAEASSGKKRKRKEAAEEEMPPAVTSGGTEKEHADWESAVKALLKAAPGKAMGAKALRAACQASVTGAAGLEKKKAKKAFAGALASLAPKVSHDEAAGVVSYSKKGKAS
jgi:hypothetical protein